MSPGCSVVRLGVTELLRASGVRWQRIPGAEVRSRYHMEALLRATIFGQARRGFFDGEFNYSRKGAEAQRRRKENKGNSLRISLRLCAFARDQ